MIVLVEGMYLGLTRASTSPGERPQNQRLRVAIA